MKKPNLFVLLALLASTHSFAQSNGSKGNGEGTIVNGKLRLVDMVDATSCLNGWRNGAELIASNSELESRLQKIKALNWYFELTLRREIKQLDFCFTSAEIKHAPPNNKNSVLFYDNVQKLPVGLRLFAAKEVYVQNERFHEFGPQDQAQFVIHEAMHTFIPLDVDMRDDKLHNIVHQIGIIQGNVATERETFERTMRRSDVMIPTGVQFIRDQKFLTYLFANEEERAEQILNNKITVMELLRPRGFNYIYSLPEQDNQLISYAAGSLKDALFLNFCIENDQAVLAKLRTQNSNDFDIDLYCTTAPGALDRILDHVESLDLNGVNKFIQSFYRGLGQVSFEVKKERVYASKEIDWISGNPTNTPKSRVALGVAPAFKIYGSENAQERLVQYERILVALSHVLSPDDWLNVVRQNNQIATAFNFNLIAAKLDAIQTSTNPAPISDEPSLVKQNLRSIYQAALQGIVDSLNFHEREDYAKKFSEAINQTNLGFKVDNQN